MPEIVDYAPAWLSRPSPGASFFSSEGPEKSSLGHSRNRSDGAARSENAYRGPLKTLARRGNEVFVVVDNQIRWGKLTTLKDEWQQGVKKRRQHVGVADGEGRESSTGETSPPEKEKQEDILKAVGSQYRVLTTSIYGSIKQLIPSPNGAFLAIITPNTIHIALLPDSAHLSPSNLSPMKLKTYQLGRTTHVIPESPVVAALWHPLGVYDSSNGCIVTITVDAAVRVWEIDRKNHWSFDRPTLAIDLKKLADGMSLDEDFAPSGFGRSKGFSADAFYMEVASACFGGRGYEEEDPWSPMTLWVAMTAGDVYALCPLLPTKWQAPVVTIPSLTTAIINKLASVESDAANLSDEERAIKQQYEWLQEIDMQEPLPAPEDSEFVEVRTRPTNPSPIPRLQGPFQFDIEDEPDDLDITDVYVISAKADLDDLADDDDDMGLGGSAQGGLSATVVCLVTSSGLVHMCLEMQPVEGQWLPKLSKGTFTAPTYEPFELLLVESLETIKESEKTEYCWPTFTEDVESRYDFYVTSTTNVTHISLSSWAQRLEGELHSTDTSGSKFRIKILCDGDIAERDRLIKASDEGSRPDDRPSHLATSLVISDYDIGYLLLTYDTSGVHAVLLESSEDADYGISRELSPFESDETKQQPLVLAPRRSPYQVPSIFYSPPPLDSFVEENIEHRHKHGLKEPIRFSPATLNAVTAAHRILSAHTHALEKAASDLFRRCERLQGEMHDQLRHLVEVAERINDVSRGTVRGTQRRLPPGAEHALDARMAAAESRQSELVDRYHNIRNKIAKAGGRPMSEREKEWSQEITGLSKRFGEPKSEDRTELVHRLKMAISLARDLASEAKQLSRNFGSPEPGTPTGKSKNKQSQIPERLQKARVADAMAMVERESTVIDAITSRLERLTTSIQ